MTTTPTNDTAHSVNGEDVSRYVAKLQALLRHAEDRAGTPEGDAFQAKAFELMQKYGLYSALQAKQQPTQEHMIRRIIEIRSIYAHGLQRMAIGIAQAVPGAHPLLAGKDNHRFVYVYGYESAVHATTVLYASLRNQILGDIQSKRGWTTAMRANPGLIRLTSMQRFIWRRDYVTGFASEVSRRLRLAHQVAANSSASATSTGAALAVRDHNAPVQEWAESFASGESKPSRLKSRDYSAVQHGVRTGRTALIGSDSTTLGGANRRELS